MEVRTTEQLTRPQTSGERSASSSDASRTNDPAHDLTAQAQRNLSADAPNSPQTVKAQEAQTVSLQGQRQDGQTAQPQPTQPIAAHVTQQRDSAPGDDRRQQSQQRHGGSGTVTHLAEFMLPADGKDRRATPDADRQGGGQGQQGQGQQGEDQQRQRPQESENGDADQASAPASLRTGSAPVVGDQPALMPANDSGAAEREAAQLQAIRAQLERGWPANGIAPSITSVSPSALVSQRRAVATAHGHDQPMSLSPHGDIRSQAPDLDIRMSAGPGPEAGQDGEQEIPQEVRQEIQQDIPGEIGSENEVGPEDGLAEAAVSKVTWPVPVDPSGSFTPLFTFENSRQPVDASMLDQLRQQGQDPVTWPVPADPSGSFTPLFTFENSRQPIDPTTLASLSTASESQPARRGRFAGFAEAARPLGVFVGLRTPTPFNPLPNGSVFAVLPLDYSARRRINLGGFNPDIRFDRMGFYGSQTLYVDPVTGISVTGIGTGPIRVPEGASKPAQESGFNVNFPFSSPLGNGIVFVNSRNNQITASQIIDLVKGNYVQLPPLISVNYGVMIDLTSTLIKTVPVAGPIVEAIRQRAGGIGSVYAGLGWRGTITIGKDTVTGGPRIAAAQFNAISFTFPQTEWRPLNDNWEPMSDAEFERWNNWGEDAAPPSLTQEPALLPEASAPLFEPGQVGPEALPVETTPEDDETGPAQGHGEVPPGSVGAMHRDAPFDHPNLGKAAAERIIRADGMTAREAEARAAQQMLQRMQGGGDDASRIAGTILLGERAVAPATPIIARQATKFLDAAIIRLRSNIRQVRNASLAEPDDYAALTESLAGMEHAATGLAEVNPEAARILQQDSDSIRQVLTDAAAAPAQIELFGFSENTAVSLVPMLRQIAQGLLNERPAKEARRERYQAQIDAVSGRLDGLLARHRADPDAFAEGDALNAALLEAELLAPERNLGEFRGLDADQLHALRDEAFLLARNPEGYAPATYVPGEDSMTPAQIRALDIPSLSFIDQVRGIVIATRQRAGQPLPGIPNRRGHDLVAILPDGRAFNLGGTQALPSGDIMLDEVLSARISALFHRTVAGDIAGFAMAPPAQAEATAAEPAIDVEASAVEAENAESGAQEATPTPAMTPAPIPAMISNALGLNFGAFVPQVMQAGRPPLDLAAPGASRGVNFLNRLRYETVQALTPGDIADIHTHFGGTCLICMMSASNPEFAAMVKKLNLPHLFGGTGGSYSFANSNKRPIHQWLSETGGADGPATNLFPVPQEDQPAFSYYASANAQGGPLTASFRLTPDGTLLLPGDIIDGSGTLIMSGENPWRYNDIDFQGASPQFAPGDANLPLTVNFYRNDPLYYHGLRKTVETMNEVVITVPDEMRHRVFIGLLPNPGRPDTVFQFQEMLAAANVLDPTGTRLQISGVGETNIQAKEIVVDRSPEKPTFANALPLAVYLGQISEPANRAMMIVHMDAGTSPVIRLPQTDHTAIITSQTDYSNIERLSAFMTLLEDQSRAEGFAMPRIVWAHIGGMGRTHKPGPGHFDMLHALARKHPDLHFDFSWDIAMAHFSQLGQGEALSEFVNAYPDRIAYGSDGIGNSYEAAFANLNLMRDDFLEHLTDAPAFLRGNAESWMAEGNAVVTRHRLANAKQLEALAPTQILNAVQGVQDAVQGEDEAQTTGIITAPEPPALPGEAPATAFDNPDMTGLADPAATSPPAAAPDITSQVERPDLEAAAGPGITSMLTGFEITSRRDYPDIVMSMADPVSGGDAAAMAEAARIRHSDALALRDALAETFAGLTANPVTPSVRNEQFLTDALMLEQAAGRDVAVLLADSNNFSTYNGLAGSAQGDAAIEQTSQAVNRVAEWLNRLYADEGVRFIGVRKAGDEMAMLGMIDPVIAGDQRHLPDMVAMDMVRVFHEELVAFNAASAMPIPNGTSSAAILHPQEFSTERELGVLLDQLDHAGVKLFNKGVVTDEGVTGGGTIWSKNAGAVILSDGTARLVTGPTYRIEPGKDALPAFRQAQGGLIDAEAAYEARQPNVASSTPLLDPLSGQTIANDQARPRILPGQPAPGNSPALLPEPEMIAQMAGLDAAVLAALDDADAPLWRDAAASERLMESLIGAINDMRAGTPLESTMRSLAAEGIAIQSQPVAIGIEGAGKGQGRIDAMIAGAREAGLTIRLEYIEPRGLREVNNEGYVIVDGARQPVAHGGGNLVIRMMVKAAHLALAETFGPDYEAQGLAMISRDRGKRFAIAYGHQTSLAERETIASRREQIYNALPAMIAADNGALHAIRMGEGKAAHPFRFSMAHASVEADAGIEGLTAQDLRNAIVMPLGEHTTRSLLDLAKDIADGLITQSLPLLPAGTERMRFRVTDHLNRREDSAAARQFDKPKDDAPVALVPLRWLGRKGPDAPGTSEDGPDDSGPGSGPGSPGRTGTERREGDGEGTPAAGLGTQALLGKIGSIAADPRYHNLFQAGGVANITRLAEPFNAGSLDIATRLASDMANGRISDFPEIWSRLREERAALEQRLTPNRDVSAFTRPRNADAMRTTWSTGREEPFRQRALMQFTQGGQEDRYGNISGVSLLEGGAPVSPTEAGALIARFANGEAENTGLVFHRAIAPLVEGRGEACLLAMQPEMHRGVPDVRRTRPPMGDAGAQTMMQDAGTLLSMIRALPAGDGRAIDLAARMTYRLMAALPDERGAGARAHILAWAALAGCGILLGPLALTGPDDGFATNPLTGEREYAFYENFLDSQIHLESEAEFVDRFEGRFAFVERLAPDLPAPAAPPAEPAPPASRPRLAARPLSAEEIGSLVTMSDPGAASGEAQAGPVAPPHAGRIGRGAEKSVSDLVGRDDLVFAAVHSADHRAPDMFEDSPAALRLLNAEHAALTLARGIGLPVIESHGVFWQPDPIGYARPGGDGRPDGAPGRYGLLLERIDGPSVLAPASKYADIVTQKTLDDLRGIRATLIAQGLSCSDFQFMIRQSDGAAIINDPGAFHSVGQFEINVSLFLLDEHLEHIGAILDWRADHPGRSAAEALRARTPDLPFGDYPAELTVSASTSWPAPQAPQGRFTELTPARFIDSLLPPEALTGDPRARAELSGKARSYATLGLRPVEPRRDEGGLMIGGVNASEMIRGLQSINGIPVGELEQAMYPATDAPHQSISGFLGEGESLIGRLVQDNETVAAHGLTHQQIAATMSWFIAMGDVYGGMRTRGTEGDTLLFNGRRFNVIRDNWGFQPSPFHDGTESRGDYEVVNLDTGERIRVATLVRDMVEHYGFYEGETRYRVDPESWIRMLGLGGADADDPGPTRPGSPSSPGGRRLPSGQEGPGAAASIAGNETGEGLFPDADPFPSGERAGQGGIVIGWPADTGEAALTIDTKNGGLSLNLKGAEGRPAFDLSAPAVQEMLSGLEVAHGPQVATARLIGGSPSGLAALAAPSMGEIEGAGAGAPARTDGADAPTPDARASLGAGPVARPPAGAQVDSRIEGIQPVIAPDLRDAARPMLRPQAPGALVARTAPPALKELPVIARPVEEIGSGGANIVYAHPDNPNLVVKMRQAGAQDPQSSAALLQTEMLNLDWLANAGFDALRPLGLVRIEGTDDVGLVLPRLRDVVFTKDFEQGMEREGLALWSEIVSRHWESLLEQLDAIREAINGSQINVADLQFAISRDGRVTIVDPYAVTAASSRPHLHHLNKLELAIASDMHALAEGRRATGPAWDDVDGL
jgi:hypothetical protein